MDYKEAQWVSEEMALKLVAGQILAGMLVGRSLASIKVVSREEIAGEEIKAAVNLARLICSECSR